MINTAGSFNFNNNNRDNNNNSKLSEYKLKRRKN
jgi:hypothetical protein